MSKYILINEAKEREQLESLSREGLINLILDMKEDAQDKYLDSLEEYD